MLSPFPGMDPYLEEPSGWPDVHQRLITYAAEVMQPVLRPRYHARIGERVYIAEPPQSFYPDVTLLQYPAQREAQAVGVAVAEADVPTVVGEYLETGPRQPFIEIVHIRSGAVVTIMEILSPSNKVGAGRQEYLRKQEQILASETHLVEIDLLRAGEHTVACPKDRLPQAYHYLACINRAKHGWAVYCIPLQRRLPRIGIPLRRPDPDIVLDVQAIFERCYESGGYEDFIDYRRAPTPPLALSDEEWADVWLKTHGKR
ncbi:MAG: DUF4058 family protein [Nitrospinae bacterium]|nr:DUF4058 family protein [Nitrospinota bacterium]